MRDFPRKNCLVAGSMAIFSAACFAGAACFMHGGLVGLYLVLAASQASIAAILFLKAKKSV
jgi:hypothetical protein